MRTAESQNRSAVFFLGGGGRRRKQPCPGASTKKLAPHFHLLAVWVSGCLMHSQRLLIGRSLSGAARFINTQFVL